MSDYEELDTREDECAEYHQNLQDTREGLSANGRNTTTTTTTTNNNNNNNRAPRVAPAPAPQEQESAAARKVLETDVSRYLKPGGAHGEHGIAWNTTAGFRFRETGVDEKWTQ